MIRIIYNPDYQLILGDDSLEIWRVLNKSKLHGLEEGNPIYGWCNKFPTSEKRDHNTANDLFVFINLSQCTNDIATTGLVFHEMMHLAGYLYNGCWDSHEEQMITFAEEETYKVVKLIKKMNDDYKSIQERMLDPDLWAEPDCEYCHGSGEYWTTVEDDKGKEIEVMYPCKCLIN